MDPNGGNNPNPPKLDNTQLQQPDPNQKPTDIFSQPQSYEQPMSTGSIPQEMPSVGPEIQEQFFAQPPLPSSFDQTMGPMAPEAPQFKDPSLNYQQPIDPDPMLNQPMMESSMPRSNGGKKKAIIMVIGIVIALAALSGVGFAAYTVGSSSGRQKAAAEFQSQQAAAQESATTATDTEPTKTDITLDLSKTVQKSDVVEESLTGDIGKQVDSSDGLALYVTNIERGFTPDDASYQIEDGKELVKVNFILGNFEDKAKDIKSADLYLLEGEKTKVLPESRLASYDGAFDSVKIESGQQSSVSIVYAVTKDATPLTFVREQIYKLISGSNETRVTSKTSINLTN